MRFIDSYQEILQDATLFDERNFMRRFEARELLEFQLLDRAASQCAAADDGPVQGQMEALSAALAEVDERLFARLRAEIAAGRHRETAFWELLREYCGSRDQDERMDGWWRTEDGPGYDLLDVFANQLCSFLPMPVPVRELEAEMVDYHKTPASVVLELARRVRAEDVFVDLGAGLGQVVLLVHLLTGAHARGLEIEPVFCIYARACAAGLGLATVEFREGDARNTDYSEGTVFFMYTPFRGELLAVVFDLLQRQAASRSFMLVTFGPCTAQAARQDWLLRVEGSDLMDGLCFFRAG